MTEEDLKAIEDEIGCKCRDDVKQEILKYEPLQLVTDCQTFDDIILENHLLRQKVNGLAVELIKMVIPRCNFRQ